MFFVRNQFDEIRFENSANKARERFMSIFGPFGDDKSASFEKFREIL